MLLSQFPLTFQQTQNRTPRVISYLMNILVLTNWDGLCHHLRDFSWGNIFKLGASAAASE